MNIDLTNHILSAKEGKTLNKPFRTPKGPKKFSVYVKNEKGNVVKVNFGDPSMEIKRDDPNRRKSFRARHNCENPGPKTKARYWSCKMWERSKSVTDYTKGSEEWDGVTLTDHDVLLTLNPSLAFVEEEVTEDGDCECGGCGCGGSDASLWENIRKKRERIKNGSGEKMRKKGDKGAPTSEQVEKAKASDDEIEMIAAQLAKSVDQLQELQEMMSRMAEDTDFEGWVQAKFTKIADYVNSLHTYLKYGNENGPSEREGEESMATYDLTDEEYNEVMSIEDVLIAARPGPKSSAQTPAKPSEKRSGSDKNKPGSASKDGPSITFSESVVNSLKNKVKEHNAKSSKKVTLAQLKKVYRRGAGAFSSSHRPGKTRGQWAMARVNMFLKMKRGGKVKDAYKRADGDI